jgi:NAD-dependent deacetylase
MKNIVILTGAGISAESGLKTFRDSDGLWNNHSIYEVATPEAWAADKQLVLDFYNHRRTELQKVEPNNGHRALTLLEPKFNTQIITQNVDNLHERGGSKNILHLHGLLTQARGEYNPDSVIDIDYKDIKLGDVNESGEQLRPHIVWFGEDVPEIMNAAKICENADYFLVIGTSLQVYPAAGLIHALPSHCEVFVIDPKAEEILIANKVTVIKEKAGTAVPALVKSLLESNS